jgi:hypothetical protein
MNVARIIRKRFRTEVAGGEIAGDVNAVVAANVGGSGQRTVVSSTQSASAASATRTQHDRKERGGDDGSRRADA